MQDFFKLPKSVKELSDLMNKSKQAFERSCKKFKDLSNKENSTLPFSRHFLSSRKCAHQHQTSINQTNIRNPSLTPCMFTF